MKTVVNIFNLFAMTGSIKYTEKQRVVLIECYIKYNYDAKCVQNELMGMAGWRNTPIPTVGTIKRTYQRFKNVCLIKDAARSGRPKKINEDMERRIEKILAKPKVGLNLKDVAKELGIGKETLRIYMKQKKHHPYKLRQTQVLLKGDASRRFEFSQWLLKEVKEHPTILSDILISDECLFSTVGIVNRQNVRVWAKKAKARRGKSQRKGFNLPSKTQSQSKVMVWMGLWQNMVIGPFVTAMSGPDTRTSSTQTSKA